LRRRTIPKSEEKLSAYITKSKKLNPSNFQKKIKIALLSNFTLDGLAEQVSEDALVYRDSNGVILNAGDTVVIIKDLPVKGAGFTAKQGVAVRNISLVPDDETHIEGRVNGVKIHLKTCFLKKS
jgi:alkylphosphonate utilization operon protein PhnA